MTLSLRLIMMMLIAVAFLLVASAFTVISNARDNVNEELDRNSRTVIQLLTAAVVSLPPDQSGLPAKALIENINALETARDITVSIGGESRSRALFNANQQNNSAPAWFRKLVAPQAREYRQIVSTPQINQLELVLLADPGAEIDESWKEARSFFSLIAGFTLLAMLLISLTIRQALKPMSAVTTALATMRGGDYSPRLPALELPELNEISSSINAMAIELEQQQEENQHLSRRMLEFQEVERRRIAQELHDELGQSITAIKVLAASSDEAGSPQASTIVDVCNRMYTSVRNLMHELRPPLLDQLGLVSALEKLSDDWNSVHENTFCALECDGNFDDLSDLLKINLYRIVQEALTNVAKHAEAESVNVYLSRMPDDSIELSISDDGKGMDNESSHAGMGLAGLRERTKACNGKFSLASQPDEGVLISIYLPSGDSDAHHAT